VAIPTIKWDGKGLQIDKYFMEHQIARPANEQLIEGEGHWVTIDGHPVFVGGNSQSVKSFVKTLPHKYTESEAENPKPNPFMQQSGDVFDFTQAVNSFTRTSYKPISNASNAINTKGVLAKDLGEYGQEAELINNAVRESEPQSEPVYRGVGTSRPHATLDNVKVGDTFTIGGVKSFSFNRTTAIGSSVPALGGKSFLFETAGPIKGISVSALSDYPEEQEFISQGKFKVTGMRTAQFIPKGPATTILTLQQVGVF
jgi:hypothetical protein